MRNSLIYLMLMIITSLIFGEVLGNSFSLLSPNSAIPKREATEELTSRELTGSDTIRRRLGDTVSRMREIRGVIDRSEKDLKQSIVNLLGEIITIEEAAYQKFQEEVEHAALFSLLDRDALSQAVYHITNSIEDYLEVVRALGIQSREDVVPALEGEGVARRNYAIGLILKYRPNLFKQYNEAFNSQVTELLAELIKKAKERKEDQASDKVVSELARIAKELSEEIAYFSESITDEEMRLQYDKLRRRIEPLLNINQAEDYLSVLYDAIHLGAIAAQEKQAPLHYSLDRARLDKLLTEIGIAESDKEISIKIWFVALLIQRLSHDSPTYGDIAFITGEPMDTIEKTHQMTQGKLVLYSVGKDSTKAEKVEIREGGMQAFTPYLRYWEGEFAQEPESYRRLFLFFYMLYHTYTGKELDLFNKPRETFVKNYETFLPLGGGSHPFQLADASFLTGLTDDNIRTIKSRIKNPEIIKKLEVKHNEILIRDGMEIRRIKLESELAESLKIIWDSFLKAPPQDIGFGPISIAEGCYHCLLEEFRSRERGGDPGLLCEVIVRSYKSGVERMAYDKNGAIRAPLFWLISYARLLLISGSEIQAKGFYLEHFRAIEKGYLETYRVSDQVTQFFSKLRINTSEPNARQLIQLFYQLGSEIEGLIVKAGENLQKRIHEEISNKDYRELEKIQQAYRDLLLLVGSFSRLSPESIDPKSVHKIPGMDHQNTRLQFELRKGILPKINSAIEQMSYLVEILRPVQNKPENNYKQNNDNNNDNKNNEDLVYLEWKLMLRGGQFNHDYPISLKIFRTQESQGSGIHMRVYSPQLGLHRARGIEGVEGIGSIFKDESLYLNLFNSLEDFISNSETSPKNSQLIELQL